MTIRLRRKCEIGFAFFLLAVESVWTLLRIFVLNIPWTANLPLHISDFAFLCLVIGLCLPSRILGHITLIVGGTVALLAMLMPDIHEMGVWRPWAYVRFYLTHGSVFLGGFYLTGIIKNHRQKDLPNFLDFLKVYALTLAYGIILIPINRRLSTNYFFTQYPPGSLPFDLRDWPWAVYFTGACAFFFVWFLAWWFFLNLVWKKRF